MSSGSCRFLHRVDKSIAIHIQWDLDIDQELGLLLSFMFFLKGMLQSGGWSQFPGWMGVSWNHQRGCNFEIRNVRVCSATVGPEKQQDEWCVWSLPLRCCRQLVWLGSVLQGTLPECHNYSCEAFLWWVSLVCAQEGTFGIESAFVLCWRSSQHRGYGVAAEETQRVLGDGVSVANM